MFPILLDSSRLKIMLIGNGVAALRRLKLLDDDGAKWVSVFADNPSPELKKAAGERLRIRLPEAEDFSGVAVVMIADFAEEKAAELAAQAREYKVLVNVEDNKKHCDYHVPAIVRREIF